MSSGQSATLDPSSVGLPGAGQGRPLADGAGPASETPPTEAATGEVSPVAWSPRDEMDRSQWLDEGRKLGAVGRGSQWWIGDWVRYGTAKWGEQYVEAAKLTDYDEASLRNLAWVAPQFGDLSLRSDKLSWSHHVLLAPLERDRKREWPKRAAEERLSVSALREMLHPKGSPELPAAPGATELIDSSEGQVTASYPNCGHRMALPGGRLRARTCAGS